VAPDRPRGRGRHTLTHYEAIDLATPGGIASIAIDVNDPGQVLGWSRDSAGAVRAFLWQDGHASAPRHLSRFYHVEKGLRASARRDDQACRLRIAGVRGKPRPTSRRLAMSRIVGTALLVVAMAACDQATPPTTPRPSALDVGSPVVPYEVIDLGKLSGMTIAFATAMNDRGQIVGFSENGRSSSHAFMWQDGVMQDLGTLGGQTFPTDINERGQVVGRSTSLGWWYPFLWSDGVMTNLDPGPGRRMDNPSAVPHINDAGQVAWTGDSLVNPHLIIHHAFLWSNGVVTDIVAGRPSAVAGINERGEIAGNTLDSGQAFVWRNGTLQFLPSLGGVANPTAINNRGQVVGTAITPSATIAHAVLWDHGEITDLGVLPGDSLSSGGFITESGKVAGMSYNDHILGGHPFLWEHGVLLPMSPTYLTDSLLFQLVGVNQRGTAAGILRGSGAVVLENGVIWKLPTLEGGIGTRAAAINARGDVVGVVTMPSPIVGQSDTRAVLWRRIDATVAALPSP